MRRTIRMRIEYDATIGIDLSIADEKDISPPHEVADKIKGDLMKMIYTEEDKKDLPDIKDISVKSLKIDVDVKDEEEDLDA